MERENKIVKGIVYYKKIEDGIKQISKIAQDYKNIGIKITKTITTSTRVGFDFENGDEWRIAPGVESSRGCACNIAYIDRMIPDDIVEKVIMPTIKAFPYQAYSYYNWGNW